MITHEQVADLREGDVVEITARHWPPGSVWRGPVYEALGDLRVAGGLVRFDDGSPLHGDEWSLTVVSRAPRPLYVNHPRPEAVLGDVARDANGIVRHAMPRTTDTRNGPQWWGSVPEHDGAWLHCSTSYMTRPLTLLVDGETGQVVL